MSTKIAVYGSLRSGLHNHRVIKNSKLLGTFNTEPIYSLHDLGSFPGLKENGSTSVVMEVYEVDDITARSVDRLEGYSPDRPATFYDKKPIETPFGEASVYTFVDPLPEKSIVKFGDWKDYVESKFRF